MHIADLPARAVAWTARWGGVLPLLAAEFVLWTGFGALLPVMPLYFTQQGVAVALLGIVIAAWPAARLVAEPIFGLVADRTARVPLMVAGLLVAAVSVGAMAIWTGPVAFILLRLVSGLGTAMYDPSARGYLTDATPADRRGEVFGLYNAAQMGGILFGPALGGLGTALVGGYTFVFVFGSVAAFAAAIAVAVRVRELPSLHRLPFPAPVLTEFPGEMTRELRDTTVGSTEGGSPQPSAAVGGPPANAQSPAAPTSLRNRFILAAILINVASSFSGGLYETIWALFVTDRGGSVFLVGATFAVFGLTTILVSPLGGRIVDRRGPFPFIAAGLLVMVVTMFAYPLVDLPILYVPMVAVEALGFSFLGPATYAVIARGSPVGRSSTAQGFIGAAATVGTITAALASGFLAAISLNLPFFVGSAVVALFLVVVVAIGGGALRSMRPARAAAPEMSSGD